MKLVQLTMVTGRAGSVEPDGEDDGIEVVTNVAAETTSPVMVEVGKVRCFYPRKPRGDGSPRTGTRLTFDNGAGMAVTELFEEVAAKFGRSN